MRSITSRELNEEGEIRFANGDLEGARTCFELVLKISPNDLLAINNLGVLLWQCGKPGEALLEFSRILSTNPDYQPAVLNASKILQENGQVEQARELLCSFLKDKPGDSELEGLLQSFNDTNPADDYSVQQSQTTASSTIRNDGVSFAATNNAEIPSTAIPIGGKDLNNQPAEEPFVSIIIPTKDRPTSLRDTLESLNAQYYTNWEAVIINDGGVDVEELIHELDHHNRFRYVRLETSKGPANARNIGIEHSTGDIHCYLDDDDMFLPSHLTIVVEALCKNQASFAYTEAEYAHEIVEDGIRKVISRDRPFSGIEYSRDRLHVGNYIPINTWAHRRELLQQSGLFDTELNALEDWDLLVRFSRLVEFIHIPLITVEVRIHEVSGQDQVSQRERKDFSALHRKIYSRYNVNDEALVRMRESILVTLDSEHHHQAG